MKHRILTTLMALVCYAVGYAGNISVDAISLKPGEAKDLKISLSSAVSEMLGVQFDVNLPDGFSLENYSDGKVYKLSSNQASDLTCTINDLGGNSFRFILYSSSLQKLKAGELMSLNLKVINSKDLGNYSVTLSNIAFSDENGNVTKESDVSGTIKVTDFFTLLYKVDGEDYRSYQKEYGEAIIPEPAPTKEGYNFSGWSEIPATMPAHDVIITGTFESFEDEKYTLNGHEYVNLGLPSGKYWSTTNYGAEKPEDAGSYLTAAESGVVATSWGISWKTPDKEDIQELLDECEWTWTTLNGVAGFSIKGPNGNTMFLPAAGTKNGDAVSGFGSLAYYQTASKNAQQTWVLQSSATIKELIAALLSSEGYPIRPVSTNNVEINEANFPDENFRNWILSNIDDNDGMLTASELESITGIDCREKQIRDLKGVEFFVNLCTLICWRNQLTFLDLSKNTKLTYLDCSENQLSFLDVSKNTALQSIECSANQLTSLDLGMLHSLTSLNCSDNPLMNLDISKNSALKTLSCAGNRLASLDTSNNSALEELQCYGNQLTSLDISNITNLRLLNCENNQLTNLDVSNNKELSSLDCSENLLASIDLSNNTKLTSLSCIGNSLTSLDLSNNTLLDFLYCIDNQLTSLDVSKNTALTHLECRINQLTNIDVSMLKNLERLLVSENQLTSLDVSNNPSLHLLGCNNNQLRLLNVSKNTELTTLECMFNYLTSIDVSRNTNIERLYVYGNFLTGLDLSKNTKLKELRCEVNQLYSLDLSNNNSLNNVIISDQYPSMINYNFDGLDGNIEQACLKVLNLSEGLAIPVPPSFDISKVSDMQLDGNGITGSVTTINGLKFLVIATAETPKSSIDGKRLSYNYDTNNNVAGLMKVDVPLLYTGDSHIWTDPETGLTWNYTISGDNAIIDQNAWATGDIVIPSAIDGYTVSRIDYNAFYCCIGLTSLTIPNTVTSMCDFVLRGCINLKKLIVMAETPPTISDYTFIDYDMPLYVPDAAVSTYKNTPIWKNFTSIKALSDMYKLGDANGDGKVTITDAVAVVNYILGNASSNFVFEAADVNGDSKITITDAVGIVNIILNGGEATAAPVLNEPEAAGQVPE